MKTLYLMYKACSRFFLKELFLILQMSIVIVLLNSAITPFVNYRRVERVSYDSLPTNSLVYSEPIGNPFVNDETDYLSVFESNVDVEAVIKTYYASALINGASADVILYNRAVFEHLPSLLDSGEWLYDTDGVYVNSALSNHIGSGKARIELYLSFDDSSADGAYVMERTPAGRIKSTEVAYNFTAPSADCMATDFQYERNVHPETPRLLALVPYDFENMKDGITSGCAVLKLRDGVQPEEFAGRYSKANLNGNLVLKPALRAESCKRLINLYRLDLMLGIMLLISSIFGIGGYTYLKTKLLQKQMGIYTICGCKKSIYRRIVLLTNAVIVAIAVALALTFKDIIDGEGYDTSASLAIAAAVAVCVYLVPVIMTVASASRLSFSKLLYYGD